MERTNCQAYINPTRCAGLMHKECKGCKFFKSKEDYDRDIRNALAYCKKEGITKYDDFFRSYFKRKDEENERKETIQGTILQNGN